MDDKEEEAYRDEETAYRFSDYSEKTTSDIICDIMHPTFENRKKGTDIFDNVVNKDLKISNLGGKKISAMNIVEFSDVAMQCHSLGASRFANHLLLIRDIMLATSSSVGGYERQMQTTSNINISRVPDKRDSGFNIFGRTKERRQ